MDFEVGKYYAPSHERGFEYLHGNTHRVLTDRFEYIGKLLIFDIYVDHWLPPDTIIFARKHIF